MGIIDEAVTDEERRRRLRGIALICVALLCFSGLDTTAKWLGQSLPALQVTYMRYFGALVIAAVVLNPRSSPGAWHTNRPWFQAFRGLTLFGSTFLNFMALKGLQLADTMAIAFATPFLVAIAAGPLLGEWIGPRRWAAILVGFLGVLVVTRPFSAGFNPAMFWSFAAVICYAAYAITTRMLAGIDSPASMLLIPATIPAIGLLPLMPFVWVWPSDGFTWLLLASLGIYGVVGHYALIRAYEFAPAPVVAPFTYTQIVWMVMLGYLVFGDVPGVYTLVGSGIVIASGLYLLFRERAVKTKSG